MELSQRAGQLSIVSLMGRGTPVSVKLYPRAPNCQEGSAGWHQQSTALIELRVMSSRSLRSAQARKRVPSLPSASLGQDATLSFVVRGRSMFWIADCGLRRGMEHGAWSKARRARREVGRDRGQPLLEVGGALRLRLEA
jgi:hypothetical protein